METRRPLRPQLLWRGTYSVICPSGRTIEGPPAGRYWVISKDKFDELNSDRRIWWGADGNNVPAIKRFLSEVQQGRVPQTLWSYDEVGHTQEAKKELISSVNFPNSDAVFETPKPTRLIHRMLQLATRPDDSSLVLDFFAGSGATLHGVMAQNSADSGNRRCILVQLPEPLPNSAGGNLSTIAEITKTRIRCAAKKIREVSPMFAGDLGFRVFKLDSSNIRAWDPDRENLSQTLLESVEHVKPDRTEQDVLFELLLKLGLELTVPIEQKSIAGKVVHSVGAGSLMVCLAPTVTRRRGRAARPRDRHLAQRTRPRRRDPGRLSRQRFPRRRRQDESHSNSPAALAAECEEPVGMAKCGIAPIAEPPTPVRQVDRLLHHPGQIIDGAVRELPPRPTSN